MNISIDSRQLEAWLFHTLYSISTRWKAGGAFFVTVLTKQITVRPVERRIA